MRRRCRLALGELSLGCHESASQRRAACVQPESYRRHRSVLAPDDAAA